MIIEELFPQKLALGNNFCNRINEQIRLRGNIEGVRPTLIISPRRYGKTSLGIYVIEQLKLPYAHLDLFPLVNNQDVQNIILSGIGEIIASIESNTIKALKSVADFFAELSISFKLVGTKIEVDLMRRSSGESKTILNALKALDNILIKKKKKAIIFLDEFQRLSQMQDPEVIEGAIRQIAQKTNNIVFIFSGSNRHLLSKMFEDRQRPLYKLCDRINLDRIDSKSYVAFISAISKKTWNKTIPLNIVETILQITERHPYYVNVLCSRLWRRDGTYTEKEVLEVWHNYALEEKSTVFNELESLSNNQLKLLITLARSDGTVMPQGDEFLSFSGMAISSVRQSLKVLQEKDYIYQDNKRFQVLDPLIKYILVERPDF